MAQENPYQPPISPAHLGQKSTPRRWIAIVLSLVALQTSVAALYASTALNQFRNGDISALTFLASASASVLLVVGGLALARKPRPATYLFFASAVFGACAYAQWHPPFIFTGLLIATCAGLVSVVSARHQQRSNNSFKPKPLRGSA
jgi:peptidoglycan/LPS O-acetylase OafA/YrhL